MENLKEMNDFKIQSKNSKVELIVRIDLGFDMSTRDKLTPREFMEMRELLLKKFYEKLTSTIENVDVFHEIHTDHLGSASVIVKPTVTLIQKERL